MGRYDRERETNAAIIIAVGRQVGASSRDILIALMTALQESGLRNLNYGDRDSVGLFQQRAGWGSRQARMNPWTSARMFYLGSSFRGGSRGLLDYAQRGRWSLTQAAQKVQRSAFPNAYAKHEATARGLLGRRGLTAPAASGRGGGTAQVAATGSWVRPVRGGRVTNTFGRPNSRYEAGHHTGVDYAVPRGTPVYAASGGTVVSVSSGGAYGNRVEIAHAGKVWTLYAHLSGTRVRRGQRVTAGQLIGLSGATGNVTGAHLHFEVRAGSNAYRSTVNPMSYLNGATTPTGRIDTAQALTSVVPAEVMEPSEQDALSFIGFKPYVYTSPVSLYGPTIIPGTEVSVPGVGADVPGLGTMAFATEGEPEQEPVETNLDAVDQLGQIDPLGVS